MKIFNNMRLKPKIKGNSNYNDKKDFDQLRKKYNNLTQNWESIKDRFEKLSATLQARGDAIGKLRSSRENMIEHINRQRTAIDTLRTRDQLYGKNLMINRYLAFAQNIENHSEQCKADVYLAYGVQALPTVDRLRHLVGGQAACDVIEIPSFAKRAVPSRLDPTVLKTIDHALAGYLREADFLTTVGWALGDLIIAEHGHADVRIIPNYRRFEKFPPNHRIREVFAIPEGAAVVLCISTVASGFEDVLRAFASLSNDTHLVAVGYFVPDTYRAEIEALRDELGLGERVHFRGPVPYDELGPFCAGADVGLVVLDPAIPNHRISLPNRVFDYLAANLPIVSPNIADIHRILAEHDCGVTIPDITSKAWADGIGQALARKEELRRNVAEAARYYTWESLEDDSMHAAFDHAGSVTFVGFNNLAKNNRTMRMAASLVAKGVTVKVASPLEEDDRLPDGVIGVALAKI